MERALRPMYDLIGNMSEQDFYNKDFWKRVTEAAETGAKNADHGAQVMMSFLEQAGVSIGEIDGDFTGIKRDIATASEESINGLAGHMNTVEHYVSSVPAMAVNISQIRALMESTLTPGVQNYGFDRETWQREAFDRFAAMERHLAENVSECKKIAKQCTDMATDIHRVIAPRGSSAVYGVQIR